MNRSNFLKKLFGISLVAPVIVAQKTFAKETTITGQTYVITATKNILLEYDGVYTPNLYGEFVCLIARVDFLKPRLEDSRCFRFSSKPILEKELSDYHFKRFKVCIDEYLKTKPEGTSITQIAPKVIFDL